MKNIKKEAAVVKRDEALYDAYVGLRRIGYTPLGAAARLYALDIPIEEVRAVAEKFGDV